MDSDNEQESQFHCEAQRNRTTKKHPSYAGVLTFYSLWYNYGTQVSKMPITDYAYTISNTQHIRFDT